MPTLVAVMGPSRDTLEQAIRYGGLCTRCVNGPTCTFPRDPAHPVRACEEFEEPAGLRPHLIVPPSIAGGAGASEPEVKGLCRHCAVRLTCTFPKPEGGIWHCDELV